MAPKTIISIAQIVFTLLLAIFVFSRNPSSLVNRIFAVFSLAVAGWSTAIGLALSFPNTPLSLYAGRFTFALAGISLYLILLLFHVFPYRLMVPPPLPVMIFGGASGLLALVSITTPLIQETVVLTRDGLRVEYGPLYPFFAIYILSSVGYCLLTMLRKMRATRGVERQQLKYFFLGLLIPGVMATVTNLVIPLVFGTSQFSQYGPLFSFLMIAMIAHAIIRHRLMDIRVVIRKGVVYIVAFAVAGGILAGLIVGSNLLFPEYPWRLGREIMLGLVVAVLFHPLKSRIQRGFDRYLYREAYDYQRTIREASRAIATMLDLRALLPYLTDVVARTVRPETVSVYLRERDGSDYRRTLRRSFIEGSVAGEPDAIPEDAPLVTLLRRERTHLLRDDLRRGDLDREARAGLEALVSLGGDLALPLLKEDQIVGFLLLGPKLSADPYFTEDLDLLSTLASQAAVAVTNAQLYAEVVLVNEYVENILKTMESGVIAVSVEGKVTLCNAAAERLTGLAAADLRSGSLTQLPPGLGDPLRATLADGIPRLQVETTLAGVDGRATPVVCSTSPFVDGRGRILGAVGVFSDLTRLKELEGEKRRAERLASFEALASGIAHEIKNPLVAIRTFAQLLPKRFAEEDFRENFSRVAVREIERIDDLVDRLRVLAAPPKPLHPLDIRGPIEDTLDLLRGQLEDKRISVSRFFPEKLPAILGEPAKLEQLFLNLFLNAVEAMEPDGALTIRLEAQEESGVPVLLVAVEDTGCGIPEALTEKVFDPFFSTKPRGTGLGLAICRGIADAHRAVIRVEPPLAARGTTISLLFPAAVATAAEVPA